MSSPTIGLFDDDDDDVVEEVKPEETITAEPSSSQPQPQASQPAHPVHEHVRWPRDSFAERSRSDTDVVALDMLAAYSEESTEDENSLGSTGLSFSAGPIEKMITQTTKPEEFSSLPPPSFTSTTEDESLKELQDALQAGSGEGIDRPGPNSEEIKFTLSPALDSPPTSTAAANANADADADAVVAVPEAFEPTQVPAAEIEDHNFPELERTADSAIPVMHSSDELAVSADEAAEDVLMEQQMAAAVEEPILTAETTGGVTAQLLAQEQQEQTERQGSPPDAAIPELKRRRLSSVRELDGSAVTKPEPTGINPQEPSSTRVSAPSRSLDDLDPATAFRDTVIGCLDVLRIKLGSRAPDAEQIKTSAEAAMSLLLDAGRRLEADLNRKELLWSVHRPDLCLKEDIALMQQDLTRKDRLIQKYKQQLNSWTNDTDPNSNSAT